jgi:hypothetical protein
MSPSAAAPEEEDLDIKGWDPDRDPSGREGRALAEALEILGWDPDSSEREGRALAEALDILG